MSIPKESRVDFLPQGELFLLISQPGLSLIGIGNIKGWAEIELKVTHQVHEIARVDFFNSSLDGQTYVHGGEEVGEERRNVPKVMRPLCLLSLPLK